MITYSEWRPWLIFWERRTVWTEYDNRPATIAAEYEYRWRWSARRRDEEAIRNSPWWMV